MIDGTHFSMCAMLAERAERLARMSIVGWWPRLRGLHVCYDESKICTTEEFVLIGLGGNDCCVSEPYSLGIAWWQISLLWEEFSQ